MQKIHFYHICTKGYNSIELHLDNDDFQTAINYSAICQYKTRIKILAYCHMNNHSHFVISAEEYDEAKNFSFLYKQAYSKYLANKYDIHQTFKRENSLIKEISDIPYLRQCIAYVLRNPLAARITLSASNYNWSSILCYFYDTSRHSDGHTYKISSLSVRQTRVLLHTKCKLKNCKYLIDHNGMVIPFSFISFRTVESIFNNSLDMFIKYISWQEDHKFDFELISQQTFHYDDREVKAIAEELSQKKYGKGIYELTPDQNRRLATIILSRHHMSAARIARILSLRKSEVEQLKKTHNL